MLQFSVKFFLDSLISPCSKEMCQIWSVAPGGPQHCSPSRRGCESIVSVNQNVTWRITGLPPDPNSCKNKVPARIGAHRQDQHAFPVQSDPVHISLQPSLAVRLIILSPQVSKHCKNPPPATSNTSFSNTPQVGGKQKSCHK